MRPSDINFFVHGGVAGLFGFLGGGGLGGGSRGDEGDTRIALGSTYAYSWSLLAMLSKDVERPSFFLCGMGG